MSKVNKTPQSVDVGGKDVNSFNERLYALWEEFGLENWSAKPEASEAIRSLVLDVIGEYEDLNAPPETYGRDDQSLGDNPRPNPDLQYVVRRATRNVYRAEMRKKVLGE